MVLAVGIAVTLLAASAGQAALLIWGIAAVGMAAAAVMWARRAWDHVEVEAAFEPPRVFVGEPVTLRVRIRNGKRLPLPVVNLGVWLPPGLFPSEGAPLGRVGYRGLWLPQEAVPEDVISKAIRGFRRRLAVAGWSETVMEFPVRVTIRGEYWLDRIEAEVADPFMLAPLQRSLRPEASLLVMPEPRINIPAEVRRRLPFGAPVRAARMFEERERFAGVRPYEPGDPLNRIHWRVTAHAGALQTKLFEPTRGASVLIALDLAVGEPFWDGIYPEIAEDAIGWASFLARQAMATGWRVGLAANTHLSRYRGALRVPPSWARGHEGALFAALARMPNEPTADMAPVVRELERELGTDTALIVLSARPGPALRDEIARARRRGLQVLELSPVDAVLAGRGG